MKTWMTRMKRAMTIQGVTQCCHCEERLRRDAAIQRPLAPRLPPMDCFVGLRPPRNDGGKAHNLPTPPFYIAPQHNPV